MADLILESNGKQLWLETVDLDFEPSLPFEHQRFTCMLWSTKGDVDQAHKLRLSQWLIKLGCRSIVCGGLECHSWHRAADEERTTLELSYENLVQTSWHDGKPESKVVFYFLACNDDFDGCPFRRYLVLILGQDNRVRKRIAKAVARQGFEEDAT